MDVYRPKKYFMVVSVALIVVLSLVLWFFAGVKILYAYLVSINFIAVLFYGYDKYQARNDGGRVPEIVLHLLALAGGSLGGLVGQLYFRHKTKKRKFQAIYVMIVVLQAGLIIGWLIKGH